MKTFQEFEQDILKQIEEKRVEKEKRSPGIQTIMKKLHGKFEFWKQFTDEEIWLLHYWFSGGIHIENIEEKMDEIFFELFLFPSWKAMRNENEINKKEILRAFLQHIQTMTISKDSYERLLNQTVYTKENRLENVYRNDGLVLTEQNEKELNTIIQNCWKELFIALFAEGERNLFSFYQSLFQWKNHPLCKNEDKDMDFPNIPREDFLTQSMSVDECNTIKEKYRVWTHVVYNEEELQEALEDSLDTSNYDFVESSLYVLKDASEIKKILKEELEKEIQSNTKYIQVQIENLGKEDVLERDIIGRINLTMKDMKTVYEILERLMRG